MQLGNVRINIRRVTWALEVTKGLNGFVQDANETEYLFLGRGTIIYFTTVRPI